MEDEQWFIPQTGVFQRPPLMCATFILDFVLHGTVVFFLPYLLIIHHTAPASGAERTAENTTK